MPHISYTHQTRTRTHTHTLIENKLHRLKRVGTIFVVYAFIHFLSLVGILPRNFLPYNETIFCFLGASLFSFYLAYHTRLIVSGKHTKYQLNHKDYVFGAMLLYNDIVNIFLYILRILGDRDD